MANEFKVKNGLIVVGDLTTSGTITINGALAATQSWVTSQAYLTSASLSGYATQSYVTSAISALIDAAPAALDTLNELAAALGDDASFSTTVTNSIASKVAKSGDTMTGSLTFASTADNVRLQKNSSFLNLRDPYNNIHLYNAGDGTYIDANVHHWRSQGASYWMTLNGTGLGIGTQSPAQKLDVIGTIRSQVTSPGAGNGDVYAFAVHEYNGNNGRMGLGLHDTGDAFLGLYSDTGVTTRIDSNGSSYFMGGNVGIGTNSPARKLVVNGETWINLTSDYFGGGTTVQISAGGTGAVGIQSNTFYLYPYSSDTATNLIYGYNGTASWNLNNGGNNRFNFFSYAGGITVMSLASSGNVGIGTTNPSYRLDVTGGDVRLSQDYSKVKINGIDLLGYGNGVLWQLGNTNYSSFALSTDWNWDTQVEFRYTPGTTGAASGILHIGQRDKNSATWTHGYTVFFTNGVERLRIDPSGNIGIGTTSPSDKLSVNGNIGVEYAGYFGFYRYPGAGHTFSTDGITSAMFGIASGIFNGRSDAGLTVSGYDQLRFYTENAERIRINRAGKVSIGTTSTNSDQSDFTVYTGGTTTLALSGGEFRVGDTDVNWSIALRQNGVLETYGQNLNLRSVAGNYPVIIQPNGVSSVSFYQSESYINTYTRINYNWGGGDYGAEALTIRGTYPSITLRSTNANFKWLLHTDASGNFRWYTGSEADNNAWTNRFTFGIDNNFYVDYGHVYVSGGNSTQWNTAYSWGNHASAGYQPAATAITTSNIGSQSVSYASTAGSLSSMNISQFTNNSGYFASGSYSWTSPVFGQYGIKSNLIDNVLYSAADRFEVFRDGAAWNTNCLFNLNYDQNCDVIAVNTSRTYSIILNTKGNGSSGITYTEGNIYLSFYYVFIPGSVSGRVKDQNGVWRNIDGWTNVANNGSYAVWRGNVPSFNYMVEIEITINANSSNNTWFAQWEYVMGRPGQYELGIFNKAQDNSVWRSLYFRDSSNVARVTINSGGISANTVTSNNFNVSNAIYFGGGNNYLNWTNSRIYTNVGIESADSLRAPIFYDSQDSNYYADFNSTVNNAIRVRGGMLMGPNPTWGAYLQVGGDGNNSSYATMSVTNGNIHIDPKNGYNLYLNHYYGSKIYFGSGGSAGGSNHHSNFSGGGNLNLGGGESDASYRLQVNGTGYASSDFRAPIFYDAADTNYYLDPNSTSVLNRVYTTGRLEVTYNVDRYQMNFLRSSGSNWWVTNDSSALGLHVNNVGDRFYFSTGGDFYSDTNGWLSSALAAKQNAATAINTSNIGSQSVSYANSAGEAGQVTNQTGQLLRFDNRIISPSETTAGYLQFGFTSWTNDNNAPYADYLHLRSYTDGSGGNDNLVMFLKSGIGMRIYQQTFGSATAYSSYADVWTSANFTSTNVSNWNTAYGWGNHASQGYATTSYVTTQINNLINGAPGALDTLDELAAALGDDANFATTVTNSIAGKMALYNGVGAPDFNTNTTNGVYRNQGGANGPAGGTHVTMFSAFQPDGNYGWQLASSSSDNIYFRFKDASFNSWVQIATRSWVTSQNYVTTAGYNNSNWDTAYGWGNHASAGYALNSSLANYLPLSGGVIGGAVTINGNLTVNGTITENSSIKLKENVETSEGNLEKVVNLRPVTYNKIGSQTTELGLIAEEVAKVYPEFVQYDENGEPVGVHYSRLTAALIGAVKELTNQVQELNKKING